MNQYVQAIYNVTGYSMDLILQVINVAEKVQQPYYLPGDMRWAIWMMYRVLREYEQLGNDRSN